MASVCETMLADYIDSDAYIPIDDIDQAIFVMTDKYMIAPWSIFAYYEYILEYSYCSYDAICDTEDYFKEVSERIYGKRE